VSTEAPAPARTAEEDARLQRALIELFEHRITFNGVLGLKVTACAGQDVRMGFAMRPDLIGHAAYGRLHGGVVASALDALSGLAVMVAIAERHPAEGTPQVMQRFMRLGTIDLRVDFLRPGLGQHFEGQAEVLRLGGRVASVASRLINDEGVLIATATGAYIVA
jgi:uncharacterized protein (TIGR00369 family)